MGKLVTSCHMEMREGLQVSLLVHPWAFRSPPLGALLLARRAPGQACASSAFLALGDRNPTMSC
jgi:hypothetical protein